MPLFADALASDTSILDLATKQGPLALLAAMIGFWWRRELSHKAERDAIQSRCDDELKIARDEQIRALTTIRTDYEVRFQSYVDKSNERIDGLIKTRQREQQKHEEVLQRIQVRLEDASITDDFYREAIRELLAAPPVETRKHHRKLDEVLVTSLSKKRQRDKASERNDRQYFGGREEP